MERHARQSAAPLPRWRRRPRAAAADPEARRLAFSTVLWLGAWYATSLGTLVLNKVILTDTALTSQALGVCQMVSTALLGAAKVYAAERREPPLKPASSESNLETLERMEAAVYEEAPPVAPLRSTLLAMGALRGLTVLLGLVSLSHVAASFTETIKSTAPLFTVYISWLVLRQRTSGPVVASLVPVMAGLVVCAKTEASFDAVGFWAAVSNNVIDCLQNVLSKKVVGKLGPVKLQFYTSILAIVFQLPLLVYREMPDLSALLDPAKRSAAAPWAADAAAPGAFGLRPGAGAARVAGLVALNVCSYHAQSVSAYFVVDKLAPVTVSVANTLKRALLILLTILYFGNEVTPESYFGIAIVVLGVFLYNWARVKYPADDAPPPPPPPSPSSPFSPPPPPAPPPPASPATPKPGLLKL